MAQGNQKFKLATSSPAEHKAGARPWLYGIGGSITALAIVFIPYLWKFSDLPLGDPESWGPFGEYVGGSLGPIVGFFTIILLIFTLQDQRAAAENARESSARQLAVGHRQAFEQTLFSWIALHRENLNAIHFNANDQTDTGDHHGLHALYHMESWKFRRDDFATNLRTHLAKVGDNDFRFGRLDAITDERYQKVLHDDIVERWKLVYAQGRYQYDAYFRVLFRLFKWIAEASEEILTDQDRWNYAALVRAQLSWIELAILSLNGQTKRGEPFIQYINRFALFDNFEAEDDKEVFRVLIKTSPEYTAAAFRSEDAKKTYFPSLIVRPPEA